MPATGSVQQTITGYNLCSRRFYGLTPRLKICKLWNFITCREPVTTTFRPDATSTTFLRVLLISASLLACTADSVANDSRLALDVIKCCLTNLATVRPLIISDNVLWILLQYHTPEGSTAKDSEGSKQDVANCASMKPYDVKCLGKKRREVRWRSQKMKKCSSFILLRETFARTANMYCTSFQDRPYYGTVQAGDGTCCTVNDMMCSFARSTVCNFLFWSFKHLCWYPWQDIWILIIANNCWLHKMSSFNVIVEIMSRIQCWL